MLQCGERFEKERQRQGTLLLSFSQKKNSPRQGHKFLSNSGLP